MRIKNLLVGSPLTLQLLLAALGTSSGLWLVGSAATGDTSVIFVRLAPYCVAIGAIASAALLILLRMSDIQRREKLFILLAAIAAVLPELYLAVLFRKFLPFNVDDAFITFRYAKNLVMGFGPTFNPGQSPVEGYTTFLWMMIMTIPHILHVDAILFSKGLNLLIAFGTIIILRMMLTDALAAEPIARQVFFGAFASFVFVAFPPTAIHINSGMETTLFTFLIALQTLIANRQIRTNSTLASMLLALSGLLCGLTRPEGNLISLALFSLAVIYDRRERRAVLVGCLILAYLIPALTYFYWRESYYSLLFPLPFYLKVIRSGTSLAGIGPVVNYLLAILPPILLFLPLALTGGAARRSILIATPALILLAFYLIPYHIMGFNSRFVYPSLPLFCVLAGIGAARLHALIPGNALPGAGIQRYALRTVLLAGIFLTGLSYSSGLSTLVGDMHAYSTAIDAYTVIGKRLHEFQSASSPVLALNDAGAIPYYSGWTTIDLLGLNDRSIATTYPSTSEKTDYVLQKRPDLVLIWSESRNNFVRDSEFSLELYRAVLSIGMEKAAVVKIGEGHYLWFMAYPGSDLGRYLGGLNSR